MKARAAILVVDMQRDFLSHSSLEPDADTLAERIADLVEWARDNACPVVHIHTIAAEDGSNWMPHWKASGRAYCIEGTKGAEPHERLNPAEGETVAIKQYYSGFEDPAAERALLADGIDTVIITGVHTHACIRATASDAYARGFDVIIAEDAVGSYDPAHGALTLDWINGRAAQCLPAQSIKAKFASNAKEDTHGAQSWQHRDPANWSRLLHDVPLARRTKVFAIAKGLAARQPRWARTPITERARLLRTWHEILAAQRDKWVKALIQDVGKPRIDAEGEVTYGLSLLEAVCSSLVDEEERETSTVRYRPLGTVGLITPWNNPFAMPVSKIAPALGYGNCAILKPALPGSAIADQLNDSLKQAGLAEWIEIVHGDAAAGNAIVEAAEISAVSFTGSVAIGQRIVRRCGELMRPVQAELGGNNAAIVLADADIDQTANDLATAMFSFSGQRCTSIRRVIVEKGIGPAFTNSLCSAIANLKVGSPGSVDTQVGPIILKNEAEDA